MCREEGGEGGEGISEVGTEGGSGQGDRVKGEERKGGYVRSDGGRGDVSARVG